MKTKKYVNQFNIIALLFSIFAFWLMVAKNGYMLRWYEEMSLFQPTGLFFKQFLYYPGGLFRYAGTWLTQLMYYPWLGSATMIILLLLLAWLTRRGFSMPLNASALAFLVPMALLASVLQLDDALLSMKSPGYVFANTLGYLFVALAVAVYQALEQKHLLRLPYMLVLACLYFAAGFFAILAVVVCILLDAARGIRGKEWLRIAECVMAVAAVALVPQAYYLYIPGNTADYDCLYLKGLPELYMESYDLYLWMPFIVANGVILALSLLSACKVRMSGKIWMWAGGLILLAAAIWTIKAQKKTEQIRATVILLQNLEAHNWENMCGVMSVIREEPNATMQILYTLALGNLGQQIPFKADKKPRIVDQRHNEKFTMTAFINVPVDYYMGHTNKSYRWAMEHSVQYGWKVFFLKYMVKDALLNGEPELAKRYNDMLKGTLFHRQWAEKMDTYINDPSIMDQNEEFRNVLMAAEASLRGQKAAMNTTAAQQ